MKIEKNGDSTAILKMMVLAVKTNEVIRMLLGATLEAAANLNVDAVEIPKVNKK